ncbi:MAG TPA: tripartite tricarboxylate transporter substrate binding protein [Burkholderiales bacterium]|nr:tripartite tricarboxylate transporter substrate binding protein [Burkholderiales bacterium]
MKTVLSSLLAAPGLAFTVTAIAQNVAYPTKPVRIVYPFAAGGGGDLVSRTVAAELTRDFKETFVVDNRTGGNGNIGTDIVARAAPDGYTLLVTTNATIVINPQLFTKVVTYDPVKDFSPISLVASQPFVLVVHPSVPAKTVPELINLAKAKPGTLNYASSGAGGGAHLAGEMLKTFAHIDITHIPYKGSNPALAALTGGEVQFMFVAALAAMPLVEQGRLRAIALSTAKRSPALPNLPAVAEYPGLETFQSDLWYGFLAPAKTSPAIIDKLYAATKRALARPEVKARIEPSGTVLVGSSPKEFAQTIKADLARWGKVITTAKVKAEY